MLQRGVLLSSLDTAYISSISWYFICLFGLSGLQSIIIGPETSQQHSSLSTAVTQFGLLGMLFGAGAGEDRAAEVATVSESLGRIRHRSIAADAETRLLKRTIATTTTKLKTQ